MASVDGGTSWGGGGHECKQVCGCRSAVVGHYLPTSQTSHERRLFLGAGEGTGDSPGGLGASGAGLGRPLQAAPWSAKGHNSRVSWSMVVVGGGDDGWPKRHRLCNAASKGHQGLREDGGNDFSSAHGPRYEGATLLKPLPPKFGPWALSTIVRKRVSTAGVVHVWR